MVGMATVCYCQTLPSASVQPNVQIAVRSLEPALRSKSVALFLANRNSPPLLEATERNDPIHVGRAASEIVSEILSTTTNGQLARLTKCRRVNNVWQSSFQTFHNGIPVQDGGMSVTIGAINGKLLAVRSNFATLASNAATPAISAEFVKEHLHTYLGEDENSSIVRVSEPALIYAYSRHHGMQRLAYEVNVRESLPPHFYRLTIDAATGKLIEKKDLLEFVGGEAAASVISGKVLAKVHLHSPLDSAVTVGLPRVACRIGGTSFETDSLGNWTLQDSGLQSHEFTTQFSGPFELVTRYDSTNDTLRADFKQPYTYLWDDRNSHPAERDAFYHVEYARNYCHRRDTALTISDDTVRIHVNLPLACNAFYDADSNTLNFYRAGDGCENSGEVADVIYHEFGHLVAQERYENSANGRLTNASLSEGFADVFSAFLRDDPRIGIGMYPDKPSQILRSCDNTRSFPQDLNSDPHVNGEIISGAFWDLRKLIGHDAAENLFTQTEWMDPDAPDIIGKDVYQSALVNTLIDLLLVDDTDNDLGNGTPHSASILSAFAKHGITLAPVIDVTPLLVPDQEADANSYSVTVHIRYTGMVGGLDTAHVLLYYSYDDEEHFAATACKPVNDSVFIADIPQAKSGSIVRYYFSARLDIDTGHAFRWPIDGEPYAFVVGYRSNYVDNCEGDRGWSLADPSDRAVTGRWVRAMPIGTYDLPGDYVQQDTDHTPYGTMCYITGNFNSPDVEADDVDSGATTLTTNTLDLSDVASPLIRYWYYYSNDEGDNPGVPEWVTQISNDDGVTWKDIQRTHASTNGWIATVFHVSDYVTPSSKIKLRFIASDFVGAVVEAGVDDLEILAGSASSFERSQAAPGFGITGVYPNPVNISSTIAFSLPDASFTTLVVKNIFGDVVAHILDERFEAGSYNTTISSINLQPGVYWAELSTATARSIRKLIVQ